MVSSPVVYLGLILEAGPLPEPGDCWSLDQLASPGDPPGFST